MRRGGADREPVGRGLGVDEAMQAQEVVLKPVGKYLGKIPGISGACIQGDGKVALIVDLPSLISSYVATLDLNRASDDTNHIGGAAAGLAVAAWKVPGRRLPSLQRPRTASYPGKPG